MIDNKPLGERAVRRLLLLHGWTLKVKGRGTSKRATMVASNGDFWYLPTYRHGSPALWPWTYAEWAALLAAFGSSGRFGAHHRYLGGADTPFCKLNTAGSLIQF